MCLSEAHQTLHLLTTHARTTRSVSEHQQDTQTDRQAGRHTYEEAQTYTNRLSLVCLHRAVVVHLSFATLCLPEYRQTDTQTDRQTLCLHCALMLTSLSPCFLCHCAIICLICLLPGCSLRPSCSSAKPRSTLPARASKDPRPNNDCKCWGSASRASS